MSVESGQRVIGQVAVVGGGWAGLTAAVTLAAAGIPVTVFESAQTLGGRARQVGFDGVTVDNGQHLLLGAYRDTLALIHQVQPALALDQLFVRSPLCLIGPGSFALRAAALPAPLHTLIGLMRASGCSLQDKLAVIRAFVGWQRGAWRCDPSRTVASLLQGQPPDMVAKLWTPLCLAALNTPLESASAQVFLNVLRDALAAHRAASDLIIPVADLSRIFPDPAAHFIERLGGIVHRGAMVRRLAAGDAAIGVEMTGATRYFSHVVIATAPSQASALLEGIPAAASARMQIDGYSYQPITTVYLLFQVSIQLRHRMSQLAAGPGQWLFDRSLQGADQTMLAIVISADGPHRSLSHPELVRAVTSQLRNNLPGLDSGVTPTWSRVITERRATHACTPERAHPPAGRIAPGIYLAGDHTDPDYPATLEAAVRSGLRAAQAVQDRIGR